MQKEMEGALELEQAALADKEAALAREKLALAENARLKALLEQQGKTH